MTSTAAAPPAARRPGRAPGAVPAPADAAPAGAWPATVHALASLPLGLLAFALTWVLPVAVAYGAGWSLLYASPADGWRTVGLVAATAVLPTVTLALVRAVTAVQRHRFRRLEVALPTVAPTGPWWSWRPWGTSAPWRQLGYHGLSLVVGVLGGALVAASWALLVTVPLAPRVARAVVRVDTSRARALLGPSRSQALAVRVATLARSRADVVAATDAERRRIERDLHDGAQQRLVSLAMNLGMARAALTDDTPEPARRALEAAHDEATAAVADLRELVRGLHPAVLDDRGLDAALSGIAARAPLPVRLHVAVEPRCPAVVEAIAYFVVSEALTNVAKHAAATSAEVTVERAADVLRVVVQDDGRGGAVVAPGPAGGTGLLGLAQRAAAVDGTFHLHSPAGGPTTITVELPCGS